MPLGGMEVWLDRRGREGEPGDWWRAGEELTGVVSLVANGSLHVRRLQVLLLGEVRNYWVNKVSDKIYESGETTLEGSVELLRPSDSLPSGRHQLRFSFPLPPTLPSSFEGEFGWIRYVARAILSSPESDERSVSEESFLVLDAVDLAAKPLSRHPVQILDRTELVCCCLPLGVVNASLSIPRNGFLPSEVVEVSGDICNQSPKSVTELRLSLVQLAEFTAASRYEAAEDHKEMSFSITSAPLPDIRPHKTLRLHNEPIRVPPNLIPSLSRQSLTVNYLLRLEAQPGIEIEIPISIGTFDSTPNQSSMM